MTLRYFARSCALALNGTGFDVPPATTLIRTRETWSSLKSRSNSEATVWARLSLSTRAFAFEPVTAAYPVSTTEWARSLAIFAASDAICARRAVDSVAELAAKGVTATASGVTVDVAETGFVVVVVVVVVGDFVVVVVVVGGLGAVVVVVVGDFVVVVVVAEVPDDAPYSATQSTSVDSGDVGQASLVEQ